MRTLYPVDLNFPKYDGSVMFSGELAHPEQDSPGFNFQLIVLGNQAVDQAAWFNAKLLEFITSMDDDENATASMYKTDLISTPLE